MVMSQVIREVGVRIKASLAGHSECRGIFRITDEQGTFLDGVSVSYRIGGSDWVPCGASSQDSEKDGNFSQCSSIFYRIGEPVAWRFFKSGYTERTITRYTADTDFDDDLDTVILQPDNRF